MPRTRAFIPFLWRARRACLTLVCVVGGLMIFCASALGSAAVAPGWEINSRAYPTDLPPGGSGAIAIHLQNVGAAASSGTISVTDTLPPGLIATDAGDVAPFAEDGIEHNFWHCTGTQVVTCTNDPSALPVLAVGAFERIGIDVSVDANFSGNVENRLSASGGGALNAVSSSSPITLSAVPAKFGLDGFETWISNADGTVDAQAGSHPYDATFSVDFNTAGTIPAREARTVDVTLPPGLVGNPEAVPQCTRAQFDTERCPPPARLAM